MSLLNEALDGQGKFERDLPEAEVFRNSWTIT